MSEPYALIAIDVQLDFLPGGVLGVPNADEILRPLVQVARGASLVVASRDWHPENHFSFADDPEYTDGSWPPHCIQGTKGSRIHSSVRKYAQFTISKGKNPHPPDEYSAFTGKTLRPVETLEEILQRSPINTVVIGGLALDWCVAHTAFDANWLGYHTIVPLDCTRAIGDPAPTISKLTHAGVEVVDHYEV